MYIYKNINYAHPQTYMEKRLIVIKKNAASHLGRKKNKNPHSDLKQ